ncbi:MAG TPA: hypothetical protein VGE05_12200 [Novosphingobium sp.]
MAKESYRVVQWTTGQVGSVAIRHFITNPAFDLVGVYVTDPAKVGRDAGELAGIAPVGVLATDDAEAILALDADCVHFSPLLPDLDMVCRLLASGKSVVTPLGPWYPTESCRDDFVRIEEACSAGGSAFHGAGIHPGFAGDVLPLLTTRLVDRIDRIHVHEVNDHLTNPSTYIPLMGFGRDPADLLANPTRPPEVAEMFAQSMAFLAEGLGRRLDKVETKLEVATATRDIPYPGGMVEQGTVAGQHYEWTGWSDGRPFITYHWYWIMGPDHIEPRWDCGDSGYRILIEGEPPLELFLGAPKPATAERPYVGIPWTAMAGVSAIPAVCKAAPGVVTHFDLGVVLPFGVAR